MCNKWDLDGVIHFNDIITWEEYCDNCKKSDMNPVDFDYFLKLIYESLLEAYKKSDKGSRLLALNLEIDEFTTNEEIYKKTGIYKIVIGLDDIFFHCSTNVLYYLFDALNERLSYNIFDTCFSNTIWIDKYGDKRGVTEDEKFNIQEFIDNLLVFPTMSFDDIKKHLCLDNKE